MSKISGLPFLAAPTGTEFVPVLDSGVSKRALIGALVAAAAVPAIARAEAAAERSENFALVLETTTAGGWFDSLADGAAHVAEGEGYFVQDADGRFYTARRLNGVGVKGAEFATLASLRADGIRVLDIPGIRGDGVGDDTAAIQAAIDLAWSAGVSKVKFPGKGYTFLLAGEQAVYGTFTSPSGVYPFYRGLLRLRSNLTLRGFGCKLVMSGGRFNPGSVFYQTFWDGAPLENVRVTGIEIDGNLANQVIEALPANTTDGFVWQHGHLFQLGYARNIEIDHCTLHGPRGNAVQFFTDDGTPTSAAQLGEFSSGLHVHHNDIYDCFGIGVGGNGVDVLIQHNRFHGDGFWVSAIDPESALSITPCRNWRIFDNVFDFRDGLSPPERTPQFASNSPEALAARRHTRRAISPGLFFAGFPNNQYNEDTRDVWFARNTIYQGVVESYNFACGEVSSNHIYNSYEDLTGHTLIHAHAIHIGPGAGELDVKGLRNWRVHDNIVEHDMDGFGVYTTNIDGIDVGGNEVRYARRGGTRVEQCSGIVRPNRMIDCGAPRTAAEIAADPAISCGVQIYGGQSNPLRVTGQQIIETRTGAAQGMRRGVYANVAADPLTVIEDTIAVRMLEGVLQDVNNTVLAIGNGDGVGRTVELNAPLRATGLEVLGSATIGATAGDTTLTVRGGATSTRQIVFTDASQLEYKLGQQADGSFVFQNFAAGAFQRTDVEIGASGYMRFGLSWQAPMVSADGDALWFSGGKLWTKPNFDPAAPSTWPASGTDGVVVGAQA